MERLGSARKSATEALFDSSVEEASRNIRVTEAYLPAEDYARVVALYLPKEKREPFRQLVRDFIALHSQPSLGDSRLLTMEKRLEDVQRIFEAEL